MRPRTLHPPPPHLHQRSQPLQHPPIVRVPLQQVPCQRQAAHRPHPLGPIQIIIRPRHHGQHAQCLGTSLSQPQALPDGGHAHPLQLTLLGLAGLQVGGQGGGCQRALDAKHAVRLEAQQAAKQPATQWQNDTSAAAMPLQYTSAPV